MKKFLRDLPNPVLTFKLYQLFIVSQSKLIKKKNYDINIYI